jgi:chromosome segregation ATPase
MIRADGQCCMQAEVNSLQAQISKLTTKVETVMAAEEQRQCEVEVLEQEITGLKGLLEEARQQGLQAEQRVGVERDAAKADAATAGERISELQEKLAVAVERADAMRAALAQVCYTLKNNVYNLLLPQKGSGTRTFSRVP